jgi:hypothetical protein
MLSNKNKTEQVEIKYFQNVEVQLTENGWLIRESISHHHYNTPRIWIAKTPTEIFDIFTKYASKPVASKK